MDICGQCGVPTLVSSTLNWESNGVISLANSPHNRMIFFESENIDEGFKLIEELIGTPIERIVVESRARETRRYIERAFKIPKEMQEALASIGTGGGGEGGSSLRDMQLKVIRMVVSSMIEISSAYGYGDQRPSERWETGGEFPWRSQTISNPYSLLFVCADNLGAVEASEGVSMGYRYTETGENTYLLEAFPEEHPLELKERLRAKRYEFKPGDIFWERCPECGVPLDVAARTWDPARGTITDPATGRRMAIFGPAAVDAIYEDLESELGEEVPAAVIESQRRYIKTAWGGENWNREGATFQEMVALRGLGNLVEFEGDSTQLTVTVENSCLHLPMIGSMQAMVEIAYRADSSTCEWELSDDGDLTVTVKVR